MKTIIIYFNNKSKIILECSNKYLDELKMNLNESDRFLVIQGLFLNKDNINYIEVK